jgi:glycosyltransferase involved in cell wall biosynthesis
LQLGVQTIFAGFLNQSQLGAAYAAADLLVLPSDSRETWGLVVNEAMACGRPAIVSDRVGCAGDLVTDGATGAVFPFGNVDALARHLVEFAADPQRLRRMGGQARARVQRGYSIENSVDGTVRAVRSVLAQA